MSSTGYVYAIGMEGSTLIKIGQAKSPKKRLAILQTGLPFKLEIVYQLQVEDPRRIEQTLHAMLTDQHARGEWFEMPETPLPELFAQAVEQPIALVIERRNDLSPAMRALAYRVCGKRNEKGMTQKELALKVPCSPTTISNLEQHKLQTISIAHLEGIADALDVSTDYLLGRTADTGESDGREARKAKVEVE